MGLDLVVDWLLNHLGYRLLGVSLSFQRGLTKDGRPVLNVSGAITWAVVLN